MLPDIRPLNARATISMARLSEKPSIRWPPTAPSMLIISTGLRPTLSDSRPQMGVAITCASA